MQCDTIGVEIYSKHSECLRAIAQFGIAVVWNALKWTWAKKKSSSAMSFGNRNHNFRCNSLWVDSLSFKRKPFSSVNIKGINKQTNKIEWRIIIKSELPGLRPVRCAMTLLLPTKGVPSSRSHREFRFVRLCLRWHFFASMKISRLRYD